MNKLKKLLVIIIPVLLLTGCILIQKNKSKKVGKIEKDVIEVSKKPTTNKVNVKTSTFASDIIMDKLCASNENYDYMKVNNLSQIESSNFDIAIVPAYQVVDFLKID